MVKTFFTATRAASRLAVAGRPLAQTFKRPANLEHLTRRQLSSSSRKGYEYRRFDNRPSGQPNNAGDVMNFMRRRVGGDRGMVVYGIAVGGGVIYYVAQYVLCPRRRL